MKTKLIFVLITLFVGINLLLTSCGDPKDEPLYNGENNVVVVDPTKESGEIPKVIDSLITANGDWYRVNDNLLYTVSISEDRKNIIITINKYGSYYTLPVKDIVYDNCSGHNTYLCTTAHFTADTNPLKMYTVRFFYDKDIVNIAIGGSIDLKPVK